MSRYRIDRRTFLATAAASLGAAASSPTSLHAQAVQLPRRPIPKTGEPLPIIGLGTSDEFEAVPEHGDVGLKAVIMALMDHGGSMIDTAPNYGRAEELLGRWLTELGIKQSVFLCSKVSTFEGREAGLESLARSQAQLDKHPIDLMQVHSLRDVHTQVENLLEWKAAGRVRYVGITTYQGMSYDVVEAFARSGEIDFVQVDYSVVRTLAEERLIPAAADYGMAVVVNSAFGNGSYFGRLRGRPLPDWTTEFDCESWAQFSLKYILAQAGVTSVLTATSDPAHMIDNVRAGLGRLPDAAMRQRMKRYMATL